MSEIDIHKLLHRLWAHPFDRPVKIPGNGETHGVGASPDAIGGYYGIGWYQTFRDHLTGQIYKVHCSDGVNGGKSAHSDRDLEWMEEMRKRIISRTIHDHRDPIRLSPCEWAIMLNYNFGLWLDSLPGDELRTVGDSNRHLDEGQIGTINYVPVVVDPHFENQLGDPPSLVAEQIRTQDERNAREDALWGHLDVPMRGGMRQRTGRRVRGPQWARHLPNRRDTTDLVRRQAT